jgi:phosphatidylinositol-3,4,5-trisphosphate 3-phosphatase/dual-specificity protein phosphatase PTEN
MAYITKRVIAMGYPSTGFETFFRNSLDDVNKFFHKYHNNDVKIYNLCLEKERIYDKSLFNKSLVSLFPSKDHNPCPIKLILEFCVDIILYLIKNPLGTAAIHCKAGKGRTGVMICSYLIFSGLCKNSEEAFEHYAKARTYNNKVPLINLGNYNPLTEKVYKVLRKFSTS